MNEFEKEEHNDACYRFCYFLPGNCKFVLNEKSVKHKG